MLKRWYVPTGIWLLALASQAADLRFVQDQTTSMPLTQIGHQGDTLVVEGGLLADLERAIAKRLGLNPVLVATPRKRVEQLLLDGEGDVLCYYDPLWLSNAGKFQWSAPFLANSNLLVAGAKAPLPDRVSDLRQGRIGTVLGYIYPELSALTDRPAVSRDDAPDDETNFRKLLAGRTDYLLTHALFLDHMLRMQPDAARKLGGKLIIRSFDTHCALRPLAPVTLRQFDDALTQLRKSGEYDAILAKYR